MMSPLWLLLLEHIHKLLDVGSTLLRCSELRWLDVTGSHTRKHTFVELHGLIDPTAVNRLIQIQVSVDFVELQWVKSQTCRVPRMLVTTVEIVQLRQRRAFVFARYRYKLGMPNYRLF